MKKSLLLVLLIVGISFSLTACWAKPFSLDEPADDIVSIEIVLMELDSFDHTVVKKLSDDEIPDIIERLEQIEFRQVLGDPSKAYGPTIRIVYKSGHYTLISANSTEYIQDEQRGYRFKYCDKDEFDKLIDEFVSSPENTTDTTDLSHSTKFPPETDGGQLIINGQEVLPRPYVRFNDEFRYAEIPLTLIAREWGAKVEWQGSSTAQITYDGTVYDLDVVHGTLTRPTDSVNIFSVPPGSTHGAFCQVVDGELIVDSDTAWYFITGILGATMTVDLDERVVRID